MRDSTVGVRFVVQNISEAAHQDLDVCHPEAPAVESLGGDMRTTALEPVALTSVRDTLVNLLVGKTSQQQKHRHQPQQQQYATMMHATG